MTKSLLFSIDRANGAIILLSNLCHSSSVNVLSSFSLVGLRLFTAFLISHQTFSIGLRSGDYDGHSIMAPARSLMNAIVL